MPVPNTDVAATARALLRRHAPGTPDATAADRLLALLGSGAPDWAHRGADVHVTASVMLVHPGEDPDDARVLLTLHPRFDRWMQLGGHLEPDDATLTGAALRETVEESGQHPARFDNPVLLGAGAFDEIRCGGTGTRTHLDVRFLVVTDSTDLVRSSESLDLAWWPLTDLPHPHDADLALLARQARHALTGPTVANGDREAGGGVPTVPHPG